MRELILLSKQSFKHLSEADRATIEARIEHGMTVTDIATVIRRHNIINLSYLRLQFLC